MATLTIRLPDDNKLRLKKIAESQGLSVNKKRIFLSYLAIATFICLGSSNLYPF